MDYIIILIFEIFCVTEKKHKKRGFLILSSPRFEVREIWSSVLFFKKELFIFFSTVIFLFITHLCYTSSYSRMFTLITMLFLIQLDFLIHVGLYLQIVSLK